MSEFSKEKLQSIFASYEAADQQVEEAKRLLEEKLAIRSDCVKLLLDTTGSKGPYSFKGEQVKIVVRGSTHFFRGKSKGGMIEVD